MTGLIERGLGVAIAVLVAATAGAQDRPTAPDPGRELPSIQAASKPPDHGVAVQLLRDVGSDYKQFFSTETALWLGVGGGAALGVHAADKSIAQSVQESHPSLPGGSLYGTQKLQIPVAIGWWIAGAAAGSERNAETGRDLLRAQIATFSWTYAIKLATQRTRPNGESHSFPSGHASTSFATAMVLQEHFGWKVGLPAFLAATYTAASRVTDNQHWSSDTVFGAALGMACARTVTVRLRSTKVSVAPLAIHRGGGIVVTASR